MTTIQAPRDVEPFGTDQRRKPRRRIAATWIGEIALFALLVSLVIVGFTRSSSKPTHGLVSATTTVTMPGDRFAPPYLSVVAGTTVSWHNTDTDPHTVTSAPGDPATFSL